MGSTIRFLDGTQFRYRPYNRVINGPTRGLKQASQRLSELAQDSNLTSDMVYEVVSEFPKLSQRLDERRIELPEFAQLTTAWQFKKFFRNSLYSHKPKHRGSALPLTLEEVHNGFFGQERVSDEQRTKALMIANSRWGRLEKVAEFGGAFLGFLGFNMLFRLILPETTPIGHHILFFFASLGIGGVGGVMIVNSIFEARYQRLLSEAAYGRLLDFADDFNSGCSLTTTQEVADILELMNKKTRFAYLDNFAADVPQKMPFALREKWQLLSIAQSRLTLDHLSLLMQESPCLTVQKAAFEKVRSTATDEELVALLRDGTELVRELAFAELDNREDFYCQDSTDVDLAKVLIAGAEDGVDIQREIQWIRFFFHLRPEMSYGEVRDLFNRYFPSGERLNLQVSDHLVFPDHLCQRMQRVKLRRVRLNAFFMRRYIDLDRAPFILNDDILRDPMRPEGEQYPESEKELALSYVRQLHPRDQKRVIQEMYNLAALVEVLEQEANPVS
ncbi:MAG: hypothetical protein ABH823_00555 [bacterium]